VENELEVVWSSVNSSANRRLLSGRPGNMSSVRLATVSLSLALSALSVCHHHSQQSSAAVVGAAVAAAAGEMNVVCDFTTRGSLIAARPPPTTTAGEQMQREQRKADAAKIYPRWKLTMPEKVKLHQKKTKYCPGK
jgi:hypothetical protein